MWSLYYGHEVASILAADFVVVSVVLVIVMVLFYVPCSDFSLCVIVLLLN